MDDITAEWCLCSKYMNHFLALMVSSRKSIRLPTSPEMFALEATVESPVTEPRLLAAPASIDSEHNNLQEHFDSDKSPAKRRRNSKRNLRLQDITKWANLDNESRKYLKNWFKKKFADGGRINTWDDLWAQYAVHCSQKMPPLNSVAFYKAIDQEPSIKLVTKAMLLQGYTTKIAPEVWLEQHGKPIKKRKYGASMLDDDGDDDDEDDASSLTDNTPKRLRLGNAVASDSSSSGMQTSLSKVTRSQAASQGANSVPILPTTQSDPVHLFYDIFKFIFLLYTCIGNYFIKKANEATGGSNEIA